MTIFVASKKIIAMAKLIKEEHRFRDPLSYGLLGAFMLFTVLLFVEDMIWESPVIGLPIWFYLLSFLLLGGTLWYFLHIRFKLSVTDKGIKYRYEPFHPRKQRILWSDIVGYEFVETSLLASLSGQDINFSSKESLYSVCGRNGLVLHTKDGETIFLGSRSLLNHRAEIEHYLSGRSQRE